MFLAGLDISSRQIDAALIPLDPDTGLPAVVFRSAPVQKGLSDAERIRDAAHAARTLLADLDGSEVASVWVEEPFGAWRTADRVLLPIMGAVVAAVPLRMTVAKIGVQEWRRQLGLPGNLPKSEAVTEAASWLDGHNVTPVLPRGVNEHQAEALLVALAGRDLCWKATAVA